MNYLQEINILDRKEELKFWKEENAKNRAEIDQLKIKKLIEFNKKQNLDIKYQNMEEKRNQIITSQNNLELKLK